MTLRRCGAHSTRGTPGYLREWIEQVKRGQVTIFTNLSIAGAHARLGERDLRNQPGPALVIDRHTLTIDN